MEEQKAKSEIVPVIADFHAHMTESYDIVVNHGNRKGAPYRGFYWNSAKSFLSDEDVAAVAFGRCLTEGENYQGADGQGAHTLAGIINFADNRAQLLFEQLRKLALIRGYDLTEDRCLMSLYLPRTKQRVSFISGQEVPTENGHVLLVGTDFNINSRNLEETLKMGQGMNALIFGDHALMEYAALDKFNSIINGGAKLSLSRKDLERYGDYFDAISAGGKVQAQLAKDLGIPLYASSDCSDMDYLFHHYTKFNGLEGLESADSDKLKESIRASLRAGNYDPHIGGSDFAEKFLRHAPSVVLTHLAGLKTGLLKRRKDL